MKKQANTYLRLCGYAVLLLAVCRYAYLAVKAYIGPDDVAAQTQPAVSVEPQQDSTVIVSHVEDNDSVTVAVEPPHPIYSVPSFKECFPDSNDVQLRSAHRWGVPPVRNRRDAERRKSELVFAAADPFYHVDKLRESIPYLVPQAQILLHDIGRTFFDSLTVKGIPLHKMIVTSVLRTDEDVERLRRHNGNASENSCHRFGTTFDICYNRYITVQPRSGEEVASVRNDSLKWVLSEVLRDYREQGRCYIKYEVKQGCFHITTR